MARSKPSTARREDLATPDDDQQATTRRYDRTAAFYDLYDWPMDIVGGVRRRRKRLLGLARGRVLEVGVGTGRNLDLYPPEVGLSGIDVSAAMLARAQRRARSLGIDGVVELELADVRRLPFEDATFDTTVATCVFCSVADPITGLAELARVTRPDGQVLLLEHVRPRNPVLGWLFDAANPLVQRLLGPNINRRTETNVAAAGLDIVKVHRGGVWREIQARPPRTISMRGDEPERATRNRGGHNHEADR